MFGHTLSLINQLKDLVGFACGDCFRTLEGAIAALYDVNIAKALVLGTPGSLEAAVEKYLGGVK